jgi:hypothetical protein
MNELLKDIEMLQQIIYNENKQLKEMQRSEVNQAV